jgi:hypothetical protein
MGVLCPPVVPYWLAAGIRLFGEHPALLKLWLFPFLWLFAWALADLLRRFARGTERAALPLLVLSPAVLPMVNLMLDIPAVALGLAALALFVRAAERGSWWLALAAGAVAGLAMQTKYTALLVPVVIGWYGLTHRRIGPAVVAGVAAVVLFAGWEFFLYQTYHHSHFLFHLSSQEPAAVEGTSRLAVLVHEKAVLLPPLVGHLGCLAVGIGLFAGRAVGLPRNVLLAATGLWVVGVALVALLPHHATVLVHGKEPGHDKLTLAAVVWRTAGTAALLTTAAGAGLLLVRVRRGNWVRWSADSWFVVGWVLIELAGYFALTPFPAARRVVGLTMALGVLAARVVSRVTRSHPERQPPAWVMPFGVGVGVFVAALDTYDALPEKVFAEQSAAVVRAGSPHARVWFAGHWGFQYYCERAGMLPVVRGESELKAGDYLVLPVFPGAEGFYRPNSFHVPPPPPEGVAEPVAEFVWDDWLSARTIPNFYGGVDPVVGRSHPRLRVALLRLREDYVFPAVTPE